MTTVARLIALAVASLAACDASGIDPITVITAPRVLAITTEPSVMPLDGGLALAVVVVDPDGPRTGLAGAPEERPVDAVRMRACAPWKFIADPSRDCTGPDALPLERDESGRFATSAAELAAAFPSPPGVPAPPDPWRAALAAGVQLRVPIVAEVDVGGRTLIAQRALTVVAAVEHVNPQFAGLLFDGVPATTLRTGQRYSLTAGFDRATLDEASPGEPSGARERVVCNFYSPTGELDEPEAAVGEPDAPAPETTPVTYTTGAPGTTWLFAVATDQTGGMTVAAVRLAIE